MKGDILGDKIIELRKKAESLELTKLPLTELYFTQRVSNRPIRKDFDLLMTQYFRMFVRDKAFKRALSRKGATYYISYLLPNSNLYVELFSEAFKSIGFGSVPHLAHIKIYSNNEVHKNQIAQASFSLIGKGGLNAINWDELEKKFNINREECINTWKALLPPETM